MNLNQLMNSLKPRKSRKRIGRGNSSGQGKSAGRGDKGAKARSGWRQRYGYEGGQMPLSRRLPKRGFNNVEFGNFFDVINTGDLEKIFEGGAEVSREILVKRGILKPRFQRLKILGGGDLKKPLTVTAHTASAGARKKIEDAGGTLTCLMPPRKKKTRPVRPPPAPAGKAAESKGKGDKKAEKGKDGGKSAGKEKGGKKETKSKGTGKKEK